MNEEKRWDKERIRKTVFIILVAIGLATIIYMIQSIITMEKDISAMRQEIIQLQSSLGSQIGAISGNIGGISANIEASLKKESSIISDYSYQVESDKINRKELTIPLNVTVRPKEYKDGLKATIIIETKDGKTISAQAKEGAAYSYSASMMVPMKDDLRLSVSFDDGTLQKSEMLEEMYQVFEGYIMRAESGVSITSVNSQSNALKHKLTFSGTVDTNVSANIDGSNYPVSGEVQIMKNGVAIKKLPIQFDEDISTGTQNENGAQPEATAAYMAGSSITYCTNFNEVIKFKNNDLIEIRVIVKDNLGYKYIQTIHSERIDDKGMTSPTDFSNEIVVE